eukprot:scaffold4.g4969.t1
MLQSKQFVKKTKKGKVLKVVREHYLRDDIWSGTSLDPQCDPSAHKLSPDAAAYLVIDTNIALHQMDLLEHANLTDVVVPSVVLEEVKARNSSAYQRLRQLVAAAPKRFFVFANEHHRETYVKQEPGESPNDRNDRAIRVVAAWYAARLAGKKRVVFLTDDADSRRKAGEAGVEAMGSLAYARSRPDVPELQDLVGAAAAAAGTEDGAAADAAGGGQERGARANGGKPAKRSRIYAEHKPMSEITTGIKAGRYHQGALRVSRFNAFEGWVDSESVGADILISGRADMNRAMDGDVVAVELLPQEQWRAPSRRLPSAGGTGGGAGEGGEEAEEGTEDAGAHIAAQVDPGEHFDEEVPAAAESGPSSAAVAAAASGDARPTGRVVGIIRRNWRSRGYAGSLKPQAAGGGTTYALFCPVERRFPYIRIQTRQACGPGFRSALGNYATLADKRIVVALDSWEADSAHPAGHYVRTLGPIGDKETETEVLLLENDINTSPFTPAVHAADLRHLTVCSVDPPGCKDIDDALHVRPLPNGNYELGVHIADVTHFLLPGTAMDEEAGARATTVYLVQRRIDMLPKPLTEDICSLRADVERLAFSVLWEVTPGADVVSARFTKSVIRSRAALTYAEAQSRIDDERLTDEISVREANQMVEEMMLLANCTVAEHTLRAFPACALLRRHPTPPPRQFEPLLRAAAAIGASIDVSSSKALAESLDLAVQADDPYFNKLIRYADVVVHRVLMAALGLRPLPDAMRDREGVRGMVDNLNVRHRNAQMAGRASVELHTLIFFRSRQVVADARVTKASRRCWLLLGAAAPGRMGRSATGAVCRRAQADVRSNGLIVFVPKYGIEGPVYLEGPSAAAGGGAGSATQQQAGQKQQQEEGNFIYDEEKQMVRSRDGSTQYRVFDPCAVSICVEEGQGGRRTLVLRLVPRAQLSTAEQVH